jgi:hypothetical protein
MRVARTISNIDKHSRLRGEVISFVSKKDVTEVDTERLELAKNDFSYKLYIKITCCFANILLESVCKSLICGHAL